MWKPPENNPTLMDVFLLHSHPDLWPLTPFSAHPSVVCGGTLNATSSIQTLTSPFFPHAYPSYTSCRWILDAPSQETIKVSVQTFVLQSSQSCSTNYLEMKDWPVVSSCRTPDLRSESCSFPFHWAPTQKHEVLFHSLQMLQTEVLCCVLLLSFCVEKWGK